QIDKKTGRIKRFTNIPDDPYSLSSDKVLAIFDDREGNLWIGTKAGGVNVASLANLTNGKEKFVSFRYKPNKPNTIVHNDVYCITQDKTGDIWIGTGGGLTKVFWNRGQSLFDALAGNALHFETFLEKDGLPNSVIYGILEDNHGNLWLSTNRGLSEFNPSKRAIKNYGVNDGLQANEFHSNAFFKDKAGNMFFGGVNGLTVFNPETIKEYPARYNVVITRLKVFNRVIKPGEKVNGRVILRKDVTQTRSIVLSYKDKEVTLDFSALYFANPQRIKYAYRLLGFNDKWQTADPNNRSVTYTNLYDGDYVFQVRTTNVLGDWTDAPLNLKIKVLPPFWRMPWFYLVYAVLIILLLVAYRKYSIIATREKSRIALERLEHKKLLEMSEAKMKFFTNVSHEIRTPLTLISDPLNQVITSGDMDEGSRKNLALISKNVERLLTMVNQFLQLRSIDLGSARMSVSKVNVFPFFRDIVAHFEQTAHLRNIHLNMDSELDDAILYMDKEMIGTVFYNLLSNAFKFTPDHGLVSVRIFEFKRSVTPKGFISLKNLMARRQVSNWIAIEIADNGRGIPAKELRNIFHRFYQVNDAGVDQQSGSGIGLALVREYINLHKGFIKVSSKPGNGSVFTVYLRTGKGHFKSDQILNEGTALNGIEKLSVVESIKRSSSEILSSVSISNDQKGELSNLLIVEDDHEMSDYLADFFRKAYNVSQAFNGKIGMELAISQSPDLIISDVMLPEVDGFQLCRKLKTTLETSHIPVILLTAKAAEDNIVEGYELGADLYMPKPFNVKILEKQVKMLIQSRIQLRERFSKQMLLMPSDVTITSTDERFLNRLMEVTDEHLTDSEFDVMKLVNAMNMSHAVILRKLRALTGMALVDFIKNQRLKKAALILQKGKISIAEVSYMVGFSDPKYFSKCFIKEFGKTPTDYSKEFYSGSTQE
ncbi:MAG TPA: response regulator, partial [Bacteroidales bacterium]